MTKEEFTAITKAEFTAILSGTIRDIGDYTSRRAVKEYIWNDQFVDARKKIENWIESLNRLLDRLDDLVDAELMRGPRIKAE